MPLSPVGLNLISIDDIAGGKLETTGPPSCSGVDGVGDTTCCKGGTAFSLIFCNAICVFCCMTCELGTLKVTDYDTASGIDVPDPEAPRDYPVFTVDGTGNVGFTRSEYGAGIPIVFGADKLNGNVFWSGGFTDHSFVDGNTTYFYTTVSFALLLCEGEIDALLRMWVGEQIIIDNTANVDEDGFPVPSQTGYILGATLDLLSEDSPLKKMSATDRTTRITVFNGSEQQLPEGAMVATDGYLQTPGYRGLAYVLFENFIVTESTIPAIFCEVIANSNAVFPRLYGELPDPQEYFDELINGVDVGERSFLIYHPGYDQFIVGAKDDSGGGTVVDGSGITVWNANNMNLLAEWELQETYAMLRWQQFAYATCDVLPLSGHMIAMTQLTTIDLNAQIRTFHTAAGAVLDEFLGDGTATNLVGHTDGSVQFSKHTCSFISNMDLGALKDVHVVLSQNPVTGGPDMAFLIIDEAGQITYRKRIDSIFTADAAGDFYAYVRTFFPEDGLVTAHPTFEDGGPTIGSHILVFHHDQSGATTTIAIDRVTFGSDTVTIDAPVVTAMTGISLAEIEGIGVDTVVHDVLYDRIDGCYVLFLETTGASPSGRYAVKWSPFTNAIQWKVVALAPRNRKGPHNTAYISNQRYGWVNSNSIYSMDFQTGAVREVGLLTEQTLPAILGTESAQFYNSVENSITYMSNDATKPLAKVFVERVARSNVPLSDIVTTLFARVGVNFNDIDVNDLQALSLVGYTITERSSLRTIYSDLATVFRYDIIESNGKYLYKTRGEDPVEVIPYTAFGDTDDAGWLIQNQENEFARTRKINLTYRDIGRDYTSNVQSVQLPKYTNQHFDSDAAIEVTVPVVLDATTAKRLAEILLYSKIIYENTYEGVLNPGYENLDPGDVVTITLPGGSDTLTFRIRDLDIGNDHVVRIRATQEDSDIYTDQAQLFGNVGDWNVATITPPDPRIDAIIMNIPFRNDAEASFTSNTHLMYVTLLNRNTATLGDFEISIKVDGVDTYTLLPFDDYPTWGVVARSPDIVTSFYSVDTTSTMRVKFLSQSGPAIASASSLEALIDNAAMNLCIVGSEMMQFGTATDLGGGLWELTNLIRCRNGTEYGNFQHTNGENFVLLAGADGVLDDDSVRIVVLPPGAQAQKNVQVFVDNNNPFQPNPVRLWQGLNLRPWSVSGFLGAYSGDDLVMSWQGRRRYNGQTPDDGDFEDLPLTEASEAYDVYLFTDISTFSGADPSTYLRKLALTSNTYTYIAADQATDGFDNTTQRLYVLVITQGALTTVDVGAAVSFYVDHK